MDKRVIFAVAGSGKTTYIVDSLSRDKRSIIVTYTVGNYNNLCRKISEKFNGDWPENIWVMGYFTFLYGPVDKSKNSADTNIFLKRY